MDYPEHEKMKAIKADADVISSFLEWLQSQKLFLAHYHMHTPDCKRNECDYHSDEIVPLKLTIEDVLAKYLDIDLKKLSEEKEEMLKEFLERNGRI